MRLIKYLIQLILFLLLIHFFIGNSTLFSQKLQFHFDLFLEGANWVLPELPLYVVILAFFGIGALLSVFCFALWRLRIGSLLREANAKIRNLEKEVAAYRKQAVVTEDFSREKDSNQPALPASVAEPALPQTISE